MLWVPACPRSTGAAPGLGTRTHVLHQKKSRKHCQKCGRVETDYLDVAAGIVATDLSATGPRRTSEKQQGLSTSFVVLLPRPEQGVLEHPLAARGHPPGNCDLVWAALAPAW